MSRLKCFAHNKDDLLKLNFVKIRLGGMEFAAQL